MKVETSNPLVLFAVTVGIILCITFIFLSTSAPSTKNETPVISKDGFTLAPELTGINGYINTDPSFTLSSLKGKVVLVDFWTFSCINCIRTQPYLNAWHDKYADKGLVIVGIHAPEFSFEKEYANVLSAVEKAGIQYPVVLDNDFSTWRAYGNRYWPHKYLIDAEGYIRYDHIGEGSYKETEAVIQELLKEHDEKIVLSEGISHTVAQTLEGTDFSQIKTPEIYLGYTFARAPLANTEGFQPEKIVQYVYPMHKEPNLVALDGEWLNKTDYMELVSDSGRVGLTYSARNVNIVAAKPAILTVLLDGNIVSSFPTNDEQLYTVTAGDKYGTHALEIDISGKGFRLYTFTFG